MIRLILADLVRNAATWIGMLVVALAAGFIVAIGGGFVETGANYGGMVAQSLQSMASVVFTLGGITALIVLSSIAVLTVEMQRRAYALWLVVGVPPVLVGTVVVVQSAIVSLAGGLVGALIAKPVFAPLFDWVLTDWSGMERTRPMLGAPTVLWAAGAVCGVVVIVGLRAAFRAARTAPMRALRAADEPAPRRIGIGSAIMAAASLAGAIAVVSALTGSEDLSAFSGPALFLIPLIAAIFAYSGSVLFPLVLGGWTALLPARASTSWYLARRTAIFRLARSSSAIGPIMVALAIVGTLYTTSDIMEAVFLRENGSPAGWSDIPFEGAVMFLGGPLLLASIASAATVFMSGRARGRELALLQAAGATRPVIIGASLVEAVLHIVTATLLAFIATAAGSLIMSRLLDLPGLALSWRQMGTVALCALALVTLATAVPTLLSLRRSVPRVLAAE